MNGNILIFCLIFAYIAQVVLSYYQLLNFRKTMASMARKGKIAVGRKKGIFKGKAVILLISENGIILEAQGLKGTTVFARLKKISEWENRTFEELLDIVKESSWDSSVKQAIASMSNISKNDYESDGV